MSPAFEIVTLDNPGIYRDELLITAEEAIKKIEDPTGYQGIKNTIRMGEFLIPASKPPDEAFPRPVTGVAIWDAGPADPEKRDPKHKELSDTTRFTIFVRGLSNGFVEVDPPAPACRRPRSAATLQLNFSAGDRFSTDSRNINSCRRAQWIYLSWRLVQSLRLKKQKADIITEVASWLIRRSRLHPERPRFNAQRAAQQGIRWANGQGGSIISQCGTKFHPAALASVAMTRCSARGRYVNLIAAGRRVNVKAERLQLTFPTQICCAHVTHTCAQSNFTMTNPPNGVFRKCSRIRCARFSCSTLETGNVPGVAATAADHGGISASEVARCAIVSGVRIVHAVDGDPALGRTNIEVACF